jgi:CubicO group peptidase (beta-lactamase class C family)
MTRLRRIDDFLPLIYDQELVFATPGERFAYSNSGIVVLGAVIEKVSGMPYEEFIRENILLPAGMTSTGINFWDEVVPNRAMGYTRGLSGDFTATVYQVPPACADGGLETTVLDMLRFDRALTGELLLSAESKKMMYTPNLEDYGYTWSIREKAGRKSISHGGGAPGVSAMFARFPDDDMTIIVLSNYSEGAIEPARAIEAIVFGTELRPPRPPLGEALYRAIDGGQIEITPSAIGAEIERRGYRLRSPQTLNRVGYEFLGEGEIDAAVAIFELNVERFPDDANSYDSLGEAYLANGDREQGIAAYQKALEIDPEFENARQVLKRMDALP